MNDDETLSALRVYITDESVIGSEVKAILYELDTNVAAASGGVVLLDESDNYTITSNDLGSWVDIPFVSPINLFNGYAYEFGIAGFQHPTDSVYIGTTDNSLYNGEHSLFDEFGLNPNDPADLGTPTWYYLTSAPMVRMNFDQAAGIQTANDVAFSIQPNPANEELFITLEEGVQGSITLMSVTGSVVYTGTVQSGTLGIDTRAFESGIYFVSVNDGATRKVVIQH